MPDYLTRQLVALRQIPHGNQLLRAGDEFTCSPLDAGYYLDKRMAREADKPAPIVAPEAPADQPARRRGRPPRAWAEPAVPPVAESKPADEPAVPAEAPASANLTEEGDAPTTAAA